MRRIFLIVCTVDLEQRILKIESENELKLFCCVMLKIWNYIFIVFEIWRIVRTMEDCDYENHDVFQSFLWLVLCVCSLGYILSVFIIIYCKWIRWVLLQPSTFLFISYVSYGSSSLIWNLWTFWIFMHNCIINYCWCVVSIQKLF